MHAAPPPLLLKLRTGEHADKQIVLRSESCTIGGDAGCTLRLQGVGFDPVHCWLVRGSRAWAVKSCSHKTQLNGRRFDESRLQRGDRLTLAGLTMEIGDGPPIPGEREVRQSVESELSERHRAQLQQQREQLSQQLAEQHAANVEQLEKNSQRQRAELEANLVQETARSRELADTIGALSSQTEQLTAACGDYQVRCQSLQLDVDNLLARQESLIAARETAVSEVQQRLSARADGAEQELVAVRAESRQLLANLESELTTTQAQLAAEQTACAQLREESAENLAAKQTAEATIADLQAAASQLAQRQAQVDQLDDRLKERWEAQQVEADSHTREPLAAADGLAATDEIAALETQLASAHAELATQRQQAEKALRDAAAARRFVSQAEAGLTAARDAVNDAEQRASASQQRLTELQQENIALRQRGQAADSLQATWEEERQRLRAELLATKDELARSIENGAAAPACDAEQTFDQVEQTNQGESVTNHSPADAVGEQAEKDRFPPVDLPHPAFTADAPLDAAATPSPELSESATPSATETPSAIETPSAHTASSGAESPDESASGNDANDFARAAFARFRRDGSTAHAASEPSPTPLPSAPEAVDSEPANDAYSPALPDRSDLEQRATTGEHSATIDQESEPATPPNEPTFQSVNEAAPASAVEILANIGMQPEFADEPRESVTELDSETSPASSLSSQGPPRNTDTAMGAIGAISGITQSESAAISQLEQEEDEDSIELYMQDLLARVRGENAPPAPISVVPQEVPRAEEKATVYREVGAADALADDEPNEPALKADEYRPRSQAPEQANRLAAMRELANASTRSAIDKSIRLRWRTEAIGKAGVAVGCLVTSMSALWTAPAIFSLLSLGGVFATGAAVFFAYRSAGLFEKYRIAVQQFENWRRTNMAEE